MMSGSMWIFWIIIIAGLVILVKGIFQQNRGGEIKIEENAIEILKHRYIRGEIEKQEFGQKKKIFYLNIRAQSEDLLQLISIDQSWNNQFGDGESLLNLEHGYIK